MAKKADTGFREIADSIKKGNFAPVYVLMGEEAYYLDVLAGMLEERVVEEDNRDFNSSVYYGAEADVEDVATAARQFPMMADRRLVILKEAQAMQSAKSKLDKFESYLAKPTPTTVLVIVYKGEALAASSKLVKGAVKAGGVVFNSPKLRDYQLSEPIKDYCQSRKIGIDSKALSLLIEYVGADLSKLFGEIDKLIVAGGGSINRISAELIERNIGISKEFNNFELTSAMCVKDYAKAMKIVKYFSMSPRQYPAIVTGAALFKLFSNLTIAQFQRDKSDANLMKVLHLKNQFALRDLRDGMARYNYRQCMGAISAIRDFDCKCKGIGSFGNEHQLLKELIFKLMTIQ